MEPIHPSAAASLASLAVDPLPRSLSREMLQAIIDQATVIWEGANRDELEIGSPDDPCCGSHIGDIENMVSRARDENGAWVRAWVWVRDDEVEALKSPHLTGWTDADAEIALTQGWNIAQVSDSLAYGIQRDDETGTFQNNEDAMAWVDALAKEGSELHRKALAIHKRFGPPEKENLMSPATSAAILRIRELMHREGQDRSVGEFVTDLLADLRRFCDVRQLDFGQLDALADEHYMEELRE